MKIFFYKSNLEFEYPFTISKGTKTHQPSLIVCFENNGIKGYGEAPSITYYNISVEQMIDDLKTAFIDFKFEKYNSAEECWSYFNQKIIDNNFALCAIDIAFHDWFAKFNNKKLYQTFNSEWQNIPATDYTLGIDSIDLLNKKIEAHPMPIYKIKLGSGNELNILKNISEITNSKIRIDFNEGLSVNRFYELYPYFEKYNIELLEQPISKFDEEGMNALFHHSKIDIYADEYCVKENDVEKCLHKFHGINIKLTKCGGITPALRMIKKAKELNLKVMIGTMNECSIGTAAIAHLLPQISKVDMDGVLLLKEIFTSGIEFNKDAVCIEPEGIGLGVKIDEVLLQNFLIDSI